MIQASAAGAVEVSPESSPLSSAPPTAPQSPKSNSSRGSPFNFQSLSLPPPAQTPPEQPTAQKRKQRQPVGKSSLLLPSAHCYSSPMLTMLQRQQRRRTGLSASEKLFGTSSDPFPSLYFGPGPKSLISSFFLILAALDQPRPWFTILLLTACIMLIVRRILSSLCPIEHADTLLVAIIFILPYSPSVVAIFPRVYLASITRAMLSVRCIPVLLPKFEHADTWPFRRHLIYSTTVTCYWAG